MLGARTQECLRLQANGLTNKEVAARMGLTEGTVKQYAAKARFRTGIDAKQLRAAVIREECQNVIKDHCLALKGWKDRHEHELSPEARLEMNAVLGAMVCEWIAEIAPASKTPICTQS
jgi:predicted transcriptional regulator